MKEFKFKIHDSESRGQETESTDHTKQMSKLSRLTRVSRRTKKEQAVCDE